MRERTAEQCRAALAERISLRGYAADEIRVAQMRKAEAECHEDRAARLLAALDQDIAELRERLADIEGDEA